MKSEGFKLNWKQRIGFAALNGLLYVGILLLFNHFSEDELYSRNDLIFQGIFFGIVFGLGFPYTMERFGVRMASKLTRQIQPELSPDERIECEGPANLYRRREGVGGKLFLTDRKLIFASHRFNIQTGQTDIDYGKITEMIKRKTAGIVDNGLRIRTSAGKDFDFVLNDRECWIEKLQEKIELHTSVM